MAITKRHDDVVDQLDQFYAQAKRQILRHQSAITGLFPRTPIESEDAYIRDSIFCATGVWALYLAYTKRVDNDYGKAHDLGQSVVKCMRGILFAWMRQSEEKVELFKANQSPKHALHSKFNLNTGLAKDADYPHLQTSVVSLYLLFLAQMIGSGLQIVYTMDEVSFIQNLVYYVERAYRTPDYGHWEQQSNNLASTNDNSSSSDTSRQQNIDASTSSFSGINQLAEHETLAQQVNSDESLEIHATSIGMAKSALEAINGCNMFGDKGTNWSIIYSDIDAHSRNRSIFETLLPRESKTKNTDSFLLATISWPCFATHDESLYQATKSKVLRKLQGRYGLRRFLRDPYGTTVSLRDHSSGSSNNTEDNQTSKSQQQDYTTSHQQKQTDQQQSVNEQRDRSQSGKTKIRKSSFIRRNLFRSSSYQSYDSLILNSNSLRATMSKKFEHIESEWPLFVCLLIIDGIFKQDMEQIYENERLLYERLLIVDNKYGDYLMPKYYFVPPELINSEKCNPASVERLPSAEGSSTEQLYLMGQAILLVTRLLLSGLLSPNELDPCRRHMARHDKPKKVERYSTFQAKSPDLVVQTVLIAESIRLQAMMANYGIQTQTPHEVEPVQIWSPSQLVKVYEFLGVNEKLGLKGRPSRPIGALGTSKLYRICGQTILCYPLIFEVSDFYLAQDMLLLIDDIQNELNFIGRYWRMAGRPTVCILIREDHLKDVHFRDLLDLLVQFKNGQLKRSGLHIKTGRLQNLISSSCIEHLDFLHVLPHERLPQFQAFKQLVVSPKNQLFNQLSREQSVASSLDGYNSNKTVVGNSSLANNPLQASNMKSNKWTYSSKAGHSLGDTNNTVGVAADLSTSRPLTSASSYNLQAIEEQSNYESQQQTPGIEATKYPREYQQFSLYHETTLTDYQLELQNQQQPRNKSPNTSQIDYYECYKDAPTWPTLIEMIKTFTEPHGQSQILAILRDREGPKYKIDELTVDERLEHLSQEACRLRNWSVVRYCSSVLQRSVESLSPWLTSILVNGKQISLGTGSKESIINNPLTPIEINQLIQSTSDPKNPCDSVLQQEIALYIGRLISTRPDYFDGILTIRVGNFMSAMRSYLAIKTQQQQQQHRLLGDNLNYQQQQSKQQQQQQQHLQKVAKYQNRVMSGLDLKIPIKSPNITPTNSSFDLQQLHNNPNQYQQQQQQMSYPYNYNFQFGQRLDNSKVSLPLPEQYQSLDLRKTKIALNNTQNLKLGNNSNQNYSISSQLAPTDLSMSSSSSIISQSRRDSVQNNQTLTQTSKHSTRLHRNSVSTPYTHTNINISSTSSTNNIGQSTKFSRSTTSSNSSSKPSSNDNIRIKPSSAGSDINTKKLVTNICSDDETTSQQLNQSTTETTNNSVVCSVEPLESLSPSEVRKLVLKVLTDDSSLPISDRRQVTGELGRVPKDFYNKVWSLLERTSVGIVIGGKILRSVTTLTNMTQDDLNFALKVEALLNTVQCPKLRQINVELLMALYVILERNPEIRFDSEPLDTDKIINMSLKKFRSDYNRDDYGFTEYYTKSERTTMLYTYRCLLDTCIWTTNNKNNVTNANTSNIDNNTIK